MRRAVGVQALRVQALLAALRWRLGTHSLCSGACLVAWGVGGMSHLFQQAGCDAYEGRPNFATLHHTAPHRDALHGSPCCAGVHTCESGSYSHKAWLRHEGALPGHWMRGVVHKLLLPSSSSTFAMQEAAAVKEAARAAVQQVAAEAQKRKAQLLKGFASVAAAAPSIPTLNPTTTTSGPVTSAHPAPARPNPAPAATVADDLEVARVLNSKGDYDCLKVGACALCAPLHLVPWAP